MTNLNELFTAPEWRKETECFACKKSFGKFPAAMFFTFMFEEKKEEHATCKNCAIKLNKEKYAN